MSKYDKLNRHFQGLAGERWHTTFEDIEKILGFRLPASARDHAAWWANNRDTMTHKLTWLDNGWNATELNQSAGHLLFVRTSVAPVRPAPAPSCSRARRATTAAQSAHPWDEPRHTNFHIAMQWTPLGRIERTPSGHITFPEAQEIPGLYCFRIRHGDVEQRYIGQTQNLKRRFGNYRNPGPSQQTNIRLNQAITEAITSGSEISVSVVTQAAWIDRGAGLREADMSSLATRCLLENMAIVADVTEDIESLNRSRPNAAEEKTRLAPLK
jgi:hypothetical protein